MKSLAGLFLSLGVSIFRASASPAATSIFVSVSPSTTNFECTGFGMIRKDPTGNVHCARLEDVEDHCLGHHIIGYSGSAGAEGHAGEFMDAYSAVECQQYCQKSTHCQRFVWHSDTNKCNLKSLMQVRGALMSTTDMLESEDSELSLFCDTKILSTCLANPNACVTCSESKVCVTTDKNVISGPKFCMASASDNICLTNFKMSKKGNSLSDPKSVLMKNQRKLTVTVDNHGNILASDPENANVTRDSALQSASLSSSSMNLGSNYKPVNHDILNYQIPEPDNQTLATTAKYFKKKLHLPHHLLANITVVDDVPATQPSRLLSEAVTHEVNDTMFRQPGHFGVPTTTTVSPTVSPASDASSSSESTEEPGFTPMAFLPTLKSAHRHGLFSKNPHHRVAQSSQLMELKKLAGLAKRRAAHQSGQSFSQLTARNFTSHGIQMEAGVQYLGTLGDIVNHMGAMSKIKPTDLLMAVSGSRCHKRCHKKCNKSGCNKGKCNKTCNKSSSTKAPSSTNSTTCEKKTSCKSKCKKGNKCGCNKSSKSRSSLLASILDEPIYLKAPDHTSHHLPSLNKGPYHKPHHLIPSQ